MLFAAASTSAVFSLERCVLLVDDLHGGEKEIGQDLADFTADSVAGRRNKTKNKKDQSNQSLSAE